jgi:hypothetical protein
MPGVKLLVTDEHRMYVWDGERFNWVYWQNKTINKGFQRGRALALYRVELREC